MLAPLGSRPCSTESSSDNPSGSIESSQSTVPGALSSPAVFAGESDGGFTVRRRDAVGDAARVIDLFAGCGTLSLPLLPGLSHLTAAESDNAALAALKAGVDASGRGSQLTCLRADLMNAPLTPDQLHGHDAAIIDPPRAGGEAQCNSLVESGIPVIAMVSCNPASFARDAALLCDGGYQLDWLQLVDQFRFTAHVELVARFSCTA